MLSHSQKSLFSLNCIRIDSCYSVKNTAISLIERGDYAPSIVLSLKIAQIFNVPVEEIFMLVEGEDDGEE